MLGAWLRRRLARRQAVSWATALRLASYDVDRQDFAVFARTLDLEKRYRGLQGIGWREAVPDHRAAAFVARVRRQGEPGFTIRPPGRRPVYYVLKYHYPRSLFSSPLGGDARAIPTILAALETARETGEPTLSSLTTLPDDLRLPSTRRCPATRP